MELIKENLKITRKELAIRLDINRSAIQRHIQRLKKERLIEHVGGDRGGYWRVKEDVL